MSDTGTGAMVNLLANPPNPYERVGQAVNALTAARQYRAQEAVGEVYNQSIDPTTGQLDMAKFNARVAADPDARMFAGPTMQKAGEAVGAQGYGTQQQLDATRQRIAGINAQMEPFRDRIANHQFISGQELLDATDRAAKAGFADQNTVNNMRKQVADNGGPDANALNIARGANMAALTAAQQVSALAGNIQYQHTGQTLVPTQLNPYGVGYGGGPAPLQTTMSPSEAAQPVEYNIGGQKGQTTLGVFAPLAADNPVFMNALSPEQRAIVQRARRANPSLGAAPGAIPTTPPLQPPPQPPPTAGPGARPPATVPAAPVPATPTELPPYLQPPPPPPPLTATPGRLPPKGGLFTGQAPAEQKTQEEQAALSSGKLAGLTAAVSKAPQVKALYNDIDAQLNAPGWSPGFGAETAGAGRQLLERFHIVSGSKDTLDTTNAQKAQESFHKDVSLLAGQGLNDLGTNTTDARQQLAEYSQPGMTMSREGNRALVATLRGNQTALQVLGDSWQKAKAAGWDDTQYAQWLANNWSAPDKTGGRFDPRIFWLADTLGFPAQQKMIDNIHKSGGAAWAQFRKNFEYAKNQNWIVQNPDRSFSPANP